MIPLYNEEIFEKAKSIDLLPCKCYHCGNTFMTKKKNITYELIHKLGKVKFCNKECLKSFKNSKVYMQCKKCNKDVQKHTKLLDTNVFCSRSCSVSYLNTLRIRTDQYKERVMNSLRKFYSKTPKIKKDKTLNTELSIQCIKCSSFFVRKKNSKKRLCRECFILALSESGKVSASRRQIRSRDECALFNLCKAHFVKVENNKIIKDGWDADIIINDTNLVFWNGPWHYNHLNIKGVSLKQIQNRDIIKIDLFESLGFKVFIYEDRYYDPYRAFEDLKFNLTQGPESNQLYAFE